MLICKMHDFFFFARFCFAVLLYVLLNATFVITWQTYLKRSIIASVLFVRVLNKVCITVLFFPLYCYDWDFLSEKSHLIGVHFKAPSDYMLEGFLLFPKQLQVQTFYCFKEGNKYIFF